MIRNCNYSCIFRRFKILPTRGTISRRTWYPRVDTKKISVVLLKYSEHLGKTGEIIETSRGFANYHLIPNGIACYANWYNIDLYCKKPSKEPDYTSKDHTHKSDEDPSTLISRPEYILFSGRFAGYAIRLNVSTFASDRNRLTSPVSLYRVLDEFSKTHNIDILPSQIAEIREADSGTKLDVFSDLGYIKFCNIGTYVFVVNFPLIEDHENKLEFTLELMGLQLRGKQTDVDGFDFYLPQNT